MIPFTFNRLDSFAMSSMSTVNFILTAGHIKQSLHSFLNGVFGAVVFFLPSTLAWILMKYYNFLLKKKLHSLKDFKLNHSNFKDIYEVISILESLQVRIRSLVNIQYDTHPTYFQLFAKEIRITNEILTKAIAELKQKFILLDKPIGALPFGIGVRSNNELWVERPKPYEYLV